MPNEASLLEGLGKLFLMLTQTQVTCKPFTVAQQDFSIKLDDASRVQEVSMRHWSSLTTNPVQNYTANFKEHFSHLRWLTKKALKSCIKQTAKIKKPNGTWN